jgi:hypothetical protein
MQLSDSLINLVIDAPVPMGCINYVRRRHDKLIRLEEVNMRHTFSRAARDPVQLYMMQYRLR